MRLALDSSGHWVPRTKPTCLLHTWRPHQQRPFALVLHLHQHKSSRNLHLQYLAKNQSTQCCQSLITPGSDHLPVLEPHMVLMGELQFFLGLQIKQSKERTFVHQTKYTKDIVRKFMMEDSKVMVTLMSTTTTLDADEDGEHVDQKEYRSMIGSLLYLTATRPDIQFSVCLCACFQVSLRTLHQQAVNRIFRYLHHTPNFGHWYSASSSLALHGFSDADFAECRLDRKSTSGTCQFLGSSLVSWSSRKQSSVAQSTTEAEYVATASCCSQLVWITYTMSDFIVHQCDSTSAVRSIPMFHFNVIAPVP
jgi:hypothetical protein